MDELSEGRPAAFSSSPPALNGEALRQIWENERRDLGGAALLRRGLPTPAELISRTEPGRVRQQVQEFQRLIDEGQEPTEEAGVAYLTTLQNVLLEDGWSGTLDDWLQQEDCFYLWADDDGMLKKTEASWTGLTAQGG